MSALRPDVDPDGLMEFSVVFTDRSLNHMSQRFQQVMRDLSEILRGTYKADALALVPGGGTYGMESVARQLATGRKVMVIRNGFFSYRWSQIFEMGAIPAEETVLKARRTGNGPQAPFAPPPVEEVVERIRAERPDLLFAPHVETSSGMILPEDYLQAVAEAVHGVGGLFVLDCIASGCVWVDMEKTGVDVLLSAPQKGWSSPPSAGVVMLNAAARDRVKETPSTSFAMDLAKWLSIMEAYEAGGHAYHATMPTDALAAFRDNAAEARDYGLDRLAEAQWELGRRVRAALAARGLRSVAAEGFEAPGVVVCYTDDPAVQNGSKFAQAGYQIAAGVPLMVDEGPDYHSFRIGLFGLDKLKDVDGTVSRLEAALDRVFGPAQG
ncbi:aspartate aminotransferase [Meinhardsimonia xiamenensis]|jgi:aspartate aminotransferase-like enzyme|uniref:Aspartate aminotransferase n=1 Tax=Meinhardsimonia xiamenensis TaxID=990712 RepID=A0A1G9D154_9RHOB|nr:aminotransferase class V-fold PLP-dependent enzyme [Meinhardsimonia xiamenensis]PRX38167.1 aspartate aminotransferase-like enzyme [Meinhardsimonia xiamenensis]SDK57652.1 aspartate aminotransferase [Meinhardsimonia xiamenensis]